MKIYSLIKFEFNLFQREFNRSLHDKRYFVSYLIVAITGLSLYTGLWFFFELENSITITRLLGAPLLENGIHLSLPVLLLFSLLKGIYPNTVSSLFNAGDITLLFPSPLKFHEVYVSKLLMNGFRHVCVLFSTFLSLIPLFSNMRMDIVEVFLLFAYILLLVETSQIIGHLAVFLFNTHIEGGKPRLPKKMLLTSAFIIVGGSIFDFLFTKTGFNLFRYSVLLTNSPNAVFSMVYGEEQISKIFMEGLVPLLLLFVTLAFILISYAQTNISLSRFISRGRIFQDLLFGKISFSLKHAKSKTSSLLQKDALMILRNYGVQLSASLVFSFILSFVMLRYQNRLLAQIITKDIFLIFPLLTVIYLKLTLAPSDSIDEEWGASWLLQTSHVSKDMLVHAKVLFGYIISVPFVLPLLGLIIIMDQNSWGPQFGIVINLIFLFHPMKLFATNLFSNGSDLSIDLFLSNFLQIVMMFFFWIGFTIVNNFTVFTIFLYSTILASLFVTRYGTPIKYYFLELISNIYFFSLLLAGVIGFLMVFVVSLRASLFIHNWGASILSIWSILASFSTSFLVRDYLMKWTMRLYLK
jgi:hypothetical protein